MVYVDSVSRKSGEMSNDDFDVLAAMIGLVFRSPKDIINLISSVLSGIEIIPLDTVQKNTEAGIETTLVYELAKGNIFLGKIEIAENAN